MLRAFCRHWDGGESLPGLDAEEIHHLVRVRRLRSGETVEILNGRGAVARCRVEKAGPRDLTLCPESVERHPVPGMRSHLLVALPKGKTFPAVLQKAVELGAASVTPLLSCHSEVPPARVGRKADRWDAVLVEAVKQSGNPWMPVLGEPVALEQALADAPEAPVRICAALQEDARHLRDFIAERAPLRGDFQVFVGPEGDFAPEEYALLRESGCQFVSLGPIVLKVETAASLVLGALRLWAAESP